MVERRGVNMLVKELLDKYYDDVVLYTDSTVNDEMYVDLFVGNRMDVPGELLFWNVREFSCKAKNVLDIHIVR